MKKIYVYEYVDDLKQGSWHAGGGVLIVTAGNPRDSVKADGIELPEPTYVYETNALAHDRVVTFPDAGCC